MKKYLPLSLLALTSGFVYLFDLASGARSEYYAAIAHSMSFNFSNFFFGALDPAGTITLDKIPGSYWLPAIFVKLFGFSTWAVNAPNAIATVTLVIIVAITARRIATTTSPQYATLISMIAGILVAATPIVAAVARSNQPQSMFLLMLALAIDRAIVALQTASRKQLIFAGLWIAAAFQMYMIEAWAIWPALIVAWLVIPNRKFGKKILDLAIAGPISAVASTLWLIIVSVVPAANRPYIGGTYSNSAWEMVFGYNALGRFGGSSTDYRSFTPPFSGNAGWDRLFNSQVGGQIAWLIVPTAIALIALFVWRKLNPQLMFLAGVFVVMFAMFSMVAGMHQFYTSALALPMGLILGWFVLMAIEESKQWLLLAGGLLSAIWIWWNSTMYSGYFAWVPYIGALMVVALLMILVFAKYTAKTNRAMAWLFAATLALTPAVWAVDTINHPSSINPVAGDGSAIGMGGGNFGGNLMQELAPNELIAYLKNHVVGEPKYLLAVFGAQSSAPIINSTGASVLPIGGFDGSDPAPTLEQFKQLVANLDVQFVQIGGQSQGMGRMQNAVGVSAEISSWVKANCTLDTTYNDLYRCK